jgi:predicted nucleic acid-binding protein
VIVVDCAALVDALTAIKGSQELRALIADEELHAPFLLDFEIVSALRRMTRSSRLSAARAEDLLADFDDLAVYRWSADGALRMRAFSLRDNLSAYDAAYVALAEALDCRLVTRDQRLARSVGHSAEIVVL